MPTRVFLAALVALSLASVAHAEPEAVKLEAAKALMRRGSELYGKGAYADALKSYKAAYALLPNPKIDFNIGQAAQKLGDNVQAANAFSAFLERTLESADIAQQRKIAREHLAELSAHLARLQLELEPDTATATLDGQPLQGTATYAAPGSHALSVSAPGFVDATRTLELHAAENRAVHLSLEPVPKVAETPEVRDVPAAAAAPPAAPKPTPTGAELLQPAPHSGAKVAGWVLVGTAGAALVTSAIFGAYAHRDDGLLGSLVNGDPVDGVGNGPGLTPPGEAANTLRSNIRTDAMLSTVALGVGVVSAGVGLFLLLHHGSAPAPQDATSPVALAF